MRRKVLAAVLVQLGCGTATHDAPQVPVTDASTDVEVAPEDAPDVLEPELSESSTDARVGDAVPEVGRAHGLEPVDPYPLVTFPPENPYSPEKAVLGKILFWDEQISSTNKMACGTCHQPAAGGSDRRAADPESVGAGPNGIAGDADDVHGGRGIPRCDSNGMLKIDPVYASRPQVTTRKPPSYLDAMFFTQLFWDGRADEKFVDPVGGQVAIAKGGALESQAAGPPVSSVEMSCEGYSWEAIAAKLATVKPLALARNLPKDVGDAMAAHPTYPELFASAFGVPDGGPAITPVRILFAIATHERTLISNQTPWDHFNGGDDGALTPAQQRGLIVFNTKGNCGGECHRLPMFTDAGFHALGFSDPKLDPGRSNVTGLPADLGQMKTPTLRNVGLRAAGGLLHNGTNAGATLRATVEAYNNGGVSAPFDPLIQLLELTGQEQEDLLDFLENGLTDPRVKNETYPFDRPKLSTE